MSVSRFLPIPARIGAPFGDVIPKILPCRRFSHVPLALATGERYLPRLRRSVSSAAAILVEHKFRYTTL